MINHNGELTMNNAEHIPDLDVRILGIIPPETPINEVVKAYSRMKKTVNLLWLPVLHSAVRRYLFVNRSQIEIAREFLDGLLCEYTYDGDSRYQIVPVPDGLSRPKTRNMVETYKRNPGVILMSDYDLVKVSRNNGSAADGPNFIGNRDSIKDALAVSSIITDAIHEQLHFPRSGSKGWNRFGTHVTLSTFPHRQRCSGASNSGSIEYEELSFKPYAPRGLMLISADSKSAGMFGDSDYLEDAARVLEEGITGCPARSAVAFFEYSQTPHIRKDDEWKKSKEALVGKYAGNSILTEKYGKGVVQGLFRNDKAEEEEGEE
jgi:hypothetical protein